MATLVLGLVTPASAEVSIPTRTSQGEGTDPETEPAAIEESRTDAQLAAIQQGSRVEVLSERTEYAQTFAEPDGTFTTESSTGIERVRDETAHNGWRDIDLTLQEGADGVVRPASSVYGLEIHPGGEEPEAPLVSLAEGERSLGFAWVGSELPVPALEGNRATYSDVEPGVDLVVEATRYGFEHYLVLTEKPSAPEEVEVVLPVVSEGLSLEQAGQSVTVVDSDGNTVGAVGQALVWDAATDPHSESVTAQASGDLPVANVSVEEVGGDQTLVVTPDAEYLEEATYPVTIDPSVTFGAPNDTYVSTQFPNENYASADELMFGTYNSGTYKYRAFLKFSGQPIANAQIRTATLQLYGNKAYNCSASDFTVRAAGESMSNADITWNDQPGVNSTIYEAVSGAGKGGGSACPAGWLSAVDVKSLVQHAANQGKTTFSMRLTASESSNTTWRRISSSNGGHAPKLVVNFNRHPGTPSSPTVAGATMSGSTLVTNTLTPTFSTKATDLDGGSLNYTLEVYKSSSVSTSTLVTSCAKSGPSATTVSCTVPSGKLVNNTSYWVRAVVRDGVSGSNPAMSALVAFKTIVAAPAMPDIVQTGFGGFFVPTTGRILDTSTGLGGYTTPMVAREWRTVAVRGLAGVPDDQAVSAVAVVVTVLGAPAGGEVRGRPDPETDSSMLGKYGYVDQHTTSFSAVLALSEEGAIDVQTLTSGRLILDVRGFYTTDAADSAPGGYVPTTGKRVVDT